MRQVMLCTLCFLAMIASTGCGEGDAIIAPGGIAEYAADERVRLPVLLWASFPDKASAEDAFHTLLTFRRQMVAVEAWQRQLEGPLPLVGRGPYGPDVDYLLLVREGPVYANVYRSEEYPCGNINIIPVDIESPRVMAIVCAYDNRILEGPTLGPSYYVDGRLIGRRDAGWAAILEMIRVSKPNVIIMNKVRVDDIAYDEALGMQFGPNLREEMKHLDFAGEAVYYVEMLHGYVCGGSWGRIGGR